MGIFFFFLNLSCIFEVIFVRAHSLFPLLQIRLVSHRTGIGNLLAVENRLLGYQYFSSRPTSCQYFFVSSFFVLRRQKRRRNSVFRPTNFCRLQPVYFLGVYFYTLCVLYFFVLLEARGQVIETNKDNNNGSNRTDHHRSSY